MGRPRIEGMDDRIIKSFIDRGIFSKPGEVVSAALRALIREQKAKEAAERKRAYSDSTYSAQLETEHEDMEPRDASMGRMGRSAKAR